MGGERQGGCSTSNEDLENFKSDHHHHDTNGFRRPGRYNLRLKQEVFKLELCSGLMHRLKRWRVELRLIFQVKLTLKTRIMCPIQASNSLGPKYLI